MKRLFFLFLIPGLSFAQVSYVPYSTTLDEGGSEISLKSQLFQTTSVVNADGEAFGLDEGVSHSRIDLDFVGSYGFTKRFEGIVGIRGRQVSSTYIDSLKEEQAATQSGIESGLIGFKYSFKREDGMQYAFHGGYRQPLHQNKILETGETPGDVALGDDGRDIFIGISLDNQTKSNNFFGVRTLYRSPSDVLSSEVLTNIEYVMAWRSMSLGLSYEYLYSLKGDTYTDDPENKPVVFQGASAQFNSINRSWSAPGLSLNFSLGDLWRLEFKYEQVISGTSTDLGPKYSLGLIRRKRGEGQFAQINSSFKEYTVEGVVKKVAKSRRTVVIDKGLSSGLKVGAQVDFYFFDYLGGNELIASGKVVKLQASKALIKIVKRYSKKRVEEGSVARSGEIR